MIIKADYNGGFVLPIYTTEVVQTMSKNDYKSKPISWLFEYWSNKFQYYNAAKELQISDKLLLSNGTYAIIEAIEVESLE